MKKLIYRGESAIIITHTYNFIESYNFRGFPGTFEKTPFTQQSYFVSTHKQSTQVKKLIMRTQTLLNMYIWRNENEGAARRFARFIHRHRRRHLPRPPLPLRVQVREPACSDCFSSYTPSFPAKQVRNWRVIFYFIYKLKVRTQLIIITVTVSFNKVVKSLNKLVIRHLHYIYGSQHNFAT